MNPQPTHDADVPCPGLRALREARGLTQEDLGPLVDRSRRQVQRYEETGQAPLAVLQALAERWSLPLEALTAEPERGPDRALARQARQHQRACEALRDRHGPEAYGAARERVAAADPGLGALLPE